MTSLLPPGLRGLMPSRSRPPLKSSPPGCGAICGWPWAMMGLAVVAGVVLFYRLGTFRTLSSHEVFAVVPAREMIENDNWTVPTFGGLHRLRKPPLAYWLIAGSARMFGELSPLTARLPSAVAGLLLAGLMGLWAGRWYGTRAGWAAAFVQLTSVWFLIFARKAEVDLVLCLLTTAAMFLIADQPAGEQKQNSSFRWLVIYGLLSLAWLAKFHYGPAMVLIPTVLFLLVEGRGPELKKLLHPIGLVCFLAAVVVWPMLVLQHAPEAWDVWRRETVGRALGEMGHRSALFYLPGLIWLPLPWTFFAFASVRRSWQSAWQDKNKNPRERFLWIWFFTQFAIVTLSANKHHNYLLALLPIFTLLAARSLAEVVTGFHEGRWHLTRKAVCLCIAMNLLIGGMLIAGIVHKWPGLFGPALALGITLAVCGGLGWILLSRRRVFAAVAVNIVMVVIGGEVMTGRVLPHCDRRQDVQQFAQEIRENLVPDVPVCVFGMDRDPIVYHLGSPVFRYESIAQIRPTLAEHEGLYVVGYEHILAKLHKLAHADALARLPQGQRDREPVEGDVVLVKLTPRHLSERCSANAN